MLNKYEFYKISHHTKVTIMGCVYDNSIYLNFCFLKAYSLIKFGYLIMYSYFLANRVYV